MAEPTSETADTAATAAPDAALAAVGPSDASAGDEPAKVEAAAQGPAAADEAAVVSGIADLPEQNANLQASAPEIDLSLLPLHTRSLLKVEVVVTVTLAHQRRPIHEITDLGPGTLVKFEKTYDEPLELMVGNLPIARGEVVKVGDKFGLRIGKIIRPHERFASVG